MCREARDGACVGHAKEVTGRTKKSVRARETPAGCTVGGTNTDNCQTCNVQIGDSLYCSQCKTGFVPINGKCVAYNNDLVTTTAGCTKSDGNLDQSSTTCGKCTGTNYFLHKGGCYAQATAPGSRVNCAKSGIRSFGCRWILAEEDTPGPMQDAGRTVQPPDKCLPRAGQRRPGRAPPRGLSQTAA